MNQLSRNNHETTHQADLSKDLLDGRAYDKIEVRELTRIMRYLRDDIKRSGTSINLPSTWLIKCLIQNLRGLGFRSDSWLHDTYRALQALKKLAQLELNEKLIQFFEKDRITPLFPNAENFSRQDLVFFVERMHAHLISIDSEVN